MNPIGNSAAAQNPTGVLPYQVMQRKEELLEKKDDCVRSIGSSSEYIKNLDAQIKELKPQIAREEARRSHWIFFGFGTMIATAAAVVINGSVGCSAAGPLIAFGCGVALSISSMLKGDTHWDMKNHFQKKTDEAANLRNVHSEFIKEWGKTIEHADTELVVVNKQIESMLANPARILDDTPRTDGGEKKGVEVSPDDDMLVVDGVKLKKRKSLDFLKHIIHQRS